MAILTPLAPTLSCALLPCGKEIILMSWAAGLSPRCYESPVYATKTWGSFAAAEWDSLAEPISYIARLLGLVI
jgi:hypothetical protein